MSEPRIVLTLEGVLRGSGNIRLHDFAKGIERLGTVLHVAEFVATQSFKRTIHYEVSGLRQSSPAEVTIQAIPKDPRFDFRAATFDAVMSAALEVAEGAASDPRHRPLLRPFQSLASPMGRSLRSATLAVNGRSVAITESFRTYLDHLLSPVTEYFTFVSGFLEAINIHGGTRAFRIYPDVGATRVNCYFPAALTGEAVAAIGQFVTVRGVVRLRAQAAFPDEIAVTSIEAAPVDDDVPTLMSLRGAVPGLVLREISENGTSPIDA